MASNVEYYERQQQLQEGIDDCERERKRLDHQLRSYMQSDDRVAKLKAVKLQNYWKKICADEKRSKQRNEQLLREFERIDSHVSSMDARLEKLQLLKRQYEDYIERQYPNWRNVALQEQQRAETPRDSPDSRTSAGGGVQAQTSPRRASYTTPGTPSPRQDIYHREQPPPQHARPSAGGEGKPPSIPRESKSGATVQFQLSPTKTPPPYNVLHQRSDSNGSLHAEDLLPRDSAPQQAAMLQQSRSHEVEERMERSEVTRIHHTDSTVQKSTPAVVHVPSAQPSPGQGLEEEESDTMSDNGSFPQRDHGAAPYQDLRQGEATVQQASRPELGQSGLLFLLELVEEGMPEQDTQLYRCHHPDSATRHRILTAAASRRCPDSISAEQVSMVLLEQLTAVVHSLPEKCLLSESLLSDSPSLVSESAVQRHLSAQSAELWSALFHHFTLLIHFQEWNPSEVASVFIPCLLAPGSSSHSRAHALLVSLLRRANQEQTTPTEEVVASPRHQEERTPREKHAGVISSQEGGILLSTGGTGTGSLTDSGRIPPLQFGSLVEKPWSDDESISMTTPSFQEGPVIPLNQTDAYLRLTGSLKQSDTKAVVMNEESTTDDDVENQLAKAITPRGGARGGQVMMTSAPLPSSTSQPSKPTQAPVVSDDPSDLSSSPNPTPTHRSTAPPVYMPSGVQSALGSTGSSAGKRQGGIKIGSDLDTDSELDVMAASKKKQEDDDIDFDFYD